MAEIIEKVKDAGVNAAQNAADSAAAAVQNAVESAQKAIDGTIAKVEGQVAKLEGTLNKVKKLPGKASTAAADVGEFFEREKGQASTSRYIQANLPSVDGKMVKKAVLANTPDSKIIAAQLKKDVSIIKDIKEDPLASVMKSLGISLPLKAASVNKDIAEPEPTGYKAEYGKIQVKENKGGFVEVSDETPGNVRKVNLHPTGTYDAKLDNGDGVEKITGKKLTMIDKDWEIVVFENEVIVINKDCKITIKQNKFENITGKECVNIDGDRFTKIKGNMNSEINGDESEKTSGNQIKAVNGNSSITTDGNQKNQIGGSFNENIGGSTTITVGGSYNLSSGGSMIINALGPVTIQSSSKVSIKAPKISLG